MFVNREDMKSFSYSISNKHVIDFLQTSDLFQQNLNKLCKCRLYSTAAVLKYE